MTKIDRLQRDSVRAISADLHAPGVPHTIWQTDRELQELTAEIERLVAAALKSDRNHEVMVRPEELHQDEPLTLADLHEVEMDKLTAVNLSEVDDLKRSLQTWV